MKNVRTGIFLYFIISAFFDLSAEMIPDPIFFHAQYGLKDARFVLQTDVSQKEFNAEETSYDFGFPFLQLSYNGSVASPFSQLRPLGQNHALFLVVPGAIVSAGLKADFDLSSDFARIADSRSDVSGAGDLIQSYQKERLTINHHTKPGYGATADVMFHWKKNTLSLALGGILGNHSGYSLIDQNYMSYSQHPEIAIHEYEPRDLSWSWQAGAIFTHDFSIRGTPFSSLAGIHFRHIEDRRPLRAPEDFPRRDIDNDIPFIAYYGSRQYDSILTASLSIQRLDQHKIGVSKVILGINPFFGITLREAVISLEKKGTTRTDYRLSYGPDSIVDPQIVSWQSQGDFQELLADIQPEFFFGKYISIGFPAEYASRVQSVICTKSVLEKGIMRESSYGFAAVLYGRLSLFSDFMLEASLETGKLIYYSTNKESGAWRYQGYRGKIRLELAGNL